MPKPQAALQAGRSRANAVARSVRSDVQDLVRAGGGAGAVLADGGYRLVCRAARHWVTDPASVASCGFPVPGVSVVPVHRVDASAWSIRSLRQCRNRFVCPYCSWWMRRAKADEADAVVRSMRADGMTCGMMVLTLSHRLGESLRSVHGDLLDCWAAYRRERTVREYLDPCWFWALDVVIGGPNGPHPHLNVLCAIIGQASGVVAVVDPAERLAGITGDRIVRLQDRWADVVKRETGWRAARRDDVGMTWVPSGERDGAAVTAYAVGSNRSNSAGLEATDDRFRVSRSGVTPMELAVAAHLGSVECGRMLSDVARDLKGRRAFGSSSTWRARLDSLGISELAEDADAEAVYVEDTPVFGIVSSDYQANRYAIEEQLNLLASVDDVYAVRSSLASLGVHTVDL